MLTQVLTMTTTQKFPLLVLGQRVDGEVDVEPDRGAGDDGQVDPQNHLKREFFFFYVYAF